MSYCLRDRRGSALLIVLGFLSFMVVSAVAFSLWMRSERMPSSALKRAVGARHLAKAALAEAISELDYAIQDDPFPGLVKSGTGASPTVNDALSSGSSSSSGGSSELETALSTDTSFTGHYDYWRGRIFFPPDPSRIKDGTSTTGRIADIEDTVSVLTLEALGYIPAPLVNDARFLSRRTWSAKWKDFNYDAGRYAYVAINVSDYFDINRGIPDARRSSAPDGRISYAHLFGSSTSTFTGNDAETRAEKLADFVENPVSESDVPYTSLLDVHLALEGNDKGMLSPFWSLASGASPSASFYGRVGGTNSVANQLFVTDSWFPGTNTASNASSGGKASSSSSSGVRPNLNDESGKYQPFKRYVMKVFRDELLSYSNIQKDFFDALDDGNFEFIPEMGWGLLYDYLDEDSVPLSLAIPSVERIPMVAGLNIDVQKGFVAIEIENDLKSGQLQLPLPQGAPTSVSVRSKGSIVFQDIIAEIEPFLIYPFKHDHGENTTFKVQPMARLYLAPEDVTLRQGTDSKLPVQDKAYWDLGKSASSSSIKDNGVFTLVGTPQNITIPADPQTGIDTIRSSQKVSLAFALTLKDAIGVKYNADYKQNPGGGGSWERRDFQMDNGNTSFWPFTKDGRIDTSPATKSYAVHMAIWLRVTDSDGKTVDLVPASGYDDKIYLGQESSWVRGNTDMTGSDMPLMDFKISDESAEGLLAYDMPTWTSEYKSKITGSGSGADTIEVARAKTKDLRLGLGCADPRYNWGPEDWYVIAENSVITKQSLFATYDQFLGQDGRDIDVFMNTNDSEWLQSMGELAFLPRVITGGDSGSFNTWSSVTGTIVSRTAATQTAHHKFAWKSYRLFDGDSAATASDGLFERGIADDDGGGAKVNPYTDSDLIMSAAVANTPYDWWAACTNKLTDSEMKLSEGWNYAFNDNGSSSKITRDEIIKICQKMREKFKAASSSGDWLEAYDDMWAESFDSDGDNELLGVTLQNCTISGADRKYLYSFWRNCFGNRQQLFLVFLRAESAALAGAGDAATPSQLGARAVALVWRDPLPPPGTTSGSGLNRVPHRTRVLFYHQFE